MKNSFLVSAFACTVLLTTGAAFAAAPADMSISNNSFDVSNGYIHNIASPYPLGPKSFEAIPWAKMTELCHGATPRATLKGSDSCSIDVYATYNSNPKLIHVATVTMFLSNGDIVSIVNAHGYQYGLQVVSTAPGQFELDMIQS